MANSKILYFINVCQGISSLTGNEKRFRKSWFRKHFLKNLSRNDQPELSLFYSLLLTLVLMHGNFTETFAQEPLPMISGKQISPEELKEKVITFVGQELTASLDAIQDPDSIPAYLFGEPTEGGFSLGTVANALSQYQAASGKQTMGNQDPDKWIKGLLLKEVAGGSTTFAQLNVADILYRNSKGKAIEEAAFWSRSTREEQMAIIDFLDVRRFYDPQKDDIGGRPNNYYGVALLLAAYNYRLGIEKDKKLIDDLFQKSLTLLARSNGFLDDSRKLQGGFDRYHHEFVRFLWEAAVLMKDRKMQQKLKPVLLSSGKLWWDLFSHETGHSSLWGRSRQNSWDDTFEQAAFFAKNPELSPAPKEQLAAAFVAAYQYYLTHEYNHGNHLNRMLDYGRGTYSYAGRNRIWSYTIGTLKKMTQSVQDLSDALQKANVETFSATPDLPDLNYFLPFRNKERTYGLWILRQNNKTTVLPIVGNGALSDYLPVPFGLAGIEVPVAQRVPVLVPFIELEDGRVLTTAQGADSVKLYEAEKSLYLVWNTWSTLKGELTSVPIQAKVIWQIQQEHVHYQLELTATENTTIKNWQFWVPVTFAEYRPETSSFQDQEASIQISGNSNFPLSRSLTATGDSPLGKGAFQPVPFLFKMESKGISLEKDKPFRFDLQLSYSGTNGSPPKEK